MKLEPNMYVRTKWGIAKYIHNLVTKETVYRVIDKKIIYIECRAPTCAFQGK